jgi:protein-S-isoprenylcysteine O-methyltransferase Ste14
MSNLIKRISFFSYGVVSYAIFFVTFLYAIGFVGNLWVPATLDGVPDKPFIVALLINLALLGLFAVQHSVMARPTFKRWWTNYVAKPVERSTYVLFSSVALIAMFILWEPMGGVVWQIDNSIGQIVMYGLFAFGWLLVLVATFLINHFDLFGLRQVTLYLLGKKYTPLEFKVVWLYKYVRHPLYVGWFFAFWATPVMTVTHLLFALCTTAYILIAIRLEERNLVDDLPEYGAYREEVPMLIPNFSSKDQDVSGAIPERA